MLVDERRECVHFDNDEKAIDFAIDLILESAKKAITQKGSFAIALAGGSTPRPVYQKLMHRKEDIDWTKVFLFWSDERAVAIHHPESNYKMAMDSGFAKLPIPPMQIFRMKAETNIEAEAIEYETLIRTLLKKPLFDLVLLGVGEDGHTASLFPETSALHETKRLVVANFIPKINAYRMTLTIPCINESQKAVFFAWGESKREITKKILKTSERNYPASCIGTKKHRALWIT